MLNKEVGGTEAAEEEPEDAKYIGDQSKVLIESKTIIDGCLMDGYFVENIDSLQIYDLEAFLTLQSQGLYVGTQFYHSAINYSLNSLDKNMILAYNLLCFRDNYMEVNKYENHIISLCTQKKSAKRPASQIVNDDLSTKHSWNRGSWKSLSHGKNPSIVCT